jgi:hypothetical protein
LDISDDELVAQAVQTKFSDSVSGSLTCSFQNVLYRVRGRSCLSCYSTCLHIFPRILPVVRDALLFIELCQYTILHHPFNAQSLIEKFTVELLDFNVYPPARADLLCTPLLKAEKYVTEFISILVRFLARSPKIRYIFSNTKPDDYISTF